MARFLGSITLFLLFLSYPQLINSKMFKLPPYFTAGIILFLGFGCSINFDASQYVIEAGDSVEVADSMNTLVTKFHFDGTVKSEFTLYNGDVEGDIYNYYNLHDTVIIADENGDGILVTKSRLKSYYYLDNESIVFNAFLSEQGEIESVHGHPVLIHYVTESKFQVGDTLKSELRFAAVDQLEIKAYLIELALSGNKVMLDTLSINDDFVAELNYQLERSGNISLGVEYHIENEKIRVVDRVILPTIYVEKRG